MALIDDEEDKKAFERLYYKYENKVYAISYGILKNEQLAEDATSDTFLSLAKCFRKINNLEYHKLDYYIVITSRNSAKNLLRKEKDNLMTVSYDDDLYFSNDNISGYGRVFLKECIERLTDNEQEILFLKFSCGLEYDEISKALGITVSAARKRFQYAKDRLKKLLGKGNMQNE